MAPKRIAVLDERAVTGGYRDSDKAPLSMQDKQAADAALDQTQTTVASRALESENSSAASAALAGRPGDGPITDNLAFNAYVAVVTLLNIVVLGIEQDMAPKNVGISDRLFWFALECIFAFCFLVEMALRVTRSRMPLLSWLSDLWNCLDLLLVAATAVDALALVPLGVGGKIRLFTVLRALHVVRLVKLGRTVSAFRELWLLVGGLVNSMKALGWVALIGLTVLYVCAIVVTTEIGQNHDVYGKGPSYDGELWPYQKYFGDVPTSMFSLFQVITMDGWCDDIVRHVVHRQPWLGLFFVIFLFLTAFGLVNVVIGIIVENTLTAAQVADRKAEEDSAQARRKAVEQLADLLVRSDSRRTGEISLAELQVAHESAIVQELFARIGLTVEEASNIFVLLDYERRGRVELRRFADSCRELVGGAKRRDIAQVEITVGTLARHLEQLDGQFSKIEAEVGAISAMADDFVENTVRILTGFSGRAGQK